MMDFHKGRWRLALGRLVNLRYINRWIIFSADLFVSLSVSLLGVLGMFSILHIRIGEPDVLKVGLSSFVASIVSFLLFKAYHGVIRHSTLRGLWRIGGAAIGKSLLMFLLLWLLKARFSPSIYWLGGIMDSTLTIVMLVTLRVFVINVYNSVLLQLGKKRKRVNFNQVDFVVFHRKLHVHQAAHLQFEGQFLHLLAHHILNFLT